MPSTTTMTTQEQNDVLRLPLILRRKASIQQAKYAAETEDHKTDEKYVPFVNVLLTGLLSFLLFLQFSISFLAPTIATTTTTAPTTLIQPDIISISIILFFLTSVMYRHTVQETQAATTIDYTLLHLLPELIALSTIGLCYNGHAMAGFIFMLAGKFIMAGAVVTYCAVQLYCNNNNNNNNNNGNQYHDANTKTLPSKNDDDMTRTVSLV